MKNIFALTIFVLLNAGLIHGQAFTPAEFNPALWLDTADSSTVAHASAVVSSWNDKSGNGHHEGRLKRAAFLFILF